jgi:hypothetical protein
VAVELEKKSSTGKTSAARGKTFPEISYPFVWTEYKNDESMVEANDQMTLEEQRKERNKQRKLKARNAAQNVALDAAGIEQSTAENDPQVRLKDMLRTLLTAKLADGTPKYTEEKAREMASDLVGEEWAE